MNISGPKHQKSEFESVLHTKHSVAAGMSVMLGVGNKKVIVKMSAIINEAGYEIRESIVKEPELEDVFLNLTGKTIKEQ